MMLVENADKVVKHSWSVRFMALAVVLEIVSLAEPLLMPQLANFVEPDTLSAISLVLITAGVISRIIKQVKVSG